MSYQSGTFTIGAATSDYLTCDAAVADYGGVGLTGNLTWIIEADTTWTADLNLVRHNGYTFTITSTNPHYGDVNAGVEITLGADIDIFNTYFAANSTNIVENVILKTGQLTFGSSSTGAVPGSINIVRNCIILNGVLLFYQVEDVGVKTFFYNNLIINSNIRYDYTYGSTPFSSTTSVFENNSFGHSGDVGTARLSMQGGGGGISKANMIVRNNCLRTGSAGTEGFQFSNPGLLTPTAYNNGSTNATAVTPLGGTWAVSSGNISTVTDADFESVVSTSADFLKLDKGSLSANAVADPSNGQAPLSVDFTGDIDYLFSSILGDAGVAPTLSATDLQGNTYGQYGHYPIGCYNEEVA